MKNRRYVPFAGSQCARPRNVQMDRSAARAVEAPHGGPDPAGAGFGPRFVTAVSAGSALNPVNSSIIAVALVSIGHAFGAGPGTTGWLVSALYLATAVGQPTMGRLADRLGARRVYLAGLVSSTPAGCSGTPRRRWSFWWRRGW